MNAEYKNIHPYIDSLPEPIKKMVFEGVWEKRSIDIARKYSLNAIQTETLINNVLFVLIGLDDGETFLGLMTSELGISKLLSDQITKDLEKYVFAYALEAVGEKAARKEEFKDSIKTGVEVAPTTPYQIPDHAPEYKPKKRLAETTKPVAVSLVDVVKPLVGAEPVQTPVPVPRFTATTVKHENDAKKPEEVPTPTRSFVENKLSGVSTSTKEAPKPYTVDPYREPLE